MSQQAHWERVWAVFEQAIELSGAARAAFVADACRDQPVVEQAVLGMLAADDEVGTVLDRPVVQRDDGDGRRLDRAGAAATGGWTEAAVDAPADPVADARLEVPPASGPPRTVGPYRLLRRVGQGGMSVAYLAVRADDAYRRRVVVKLVREDMARTGVRRRLRAERQILAGLEHPNIARLYDGAATEAGVPYFVMEWVDGLPIDAYCRRSRLTLDQRLALFQKVCRAVQHAHQNLVVHRDIKPSNILVSAAGEPKLLDFGIAKVLDPTASPVEHEPTAAADRMLTPSYASPEQYRGASATTASDVYSLGVLLYRLLTGRLPHDLRGRSPGEIERLLTDSAPVPPSVAVTRKATDGGETVDGDRPAGATRERLARMLAGDLDAIVLKALRGLPVERYPTVDQLIADLEHHRFGLPVAARRGTWRYRLGKLARRHRAAVIAASVVAVLLAGAVSALAVQARRIAVERDAVRLERDQKAGVIALIEDLITHAEPYRAGAELTARELVLGSRRSLEGRLSAQPAVRAQLLHTTGAMLLRLSAFDDARDHLEEALALRRGLHPDGHLEVADSMRLLAAVRKEQGALVEAEALARDAVAMVRGASERDPEALASCLTALASVLCYRQAFDAAEEPIREALALVRESAGGEPMALVNLEYVAAAELRRGRYAHAVELLQQVVTRRRALYGARHPAQDMALNDLALALRWLGRYDEAEQAYEEARDMVVASYGTEHPDYALVMNNLGGVRFARGDYRGAAEAYEESRGVLARTAGPGHWRVFHVDTNLEAARIRLGDAADAERNLRAGRDRWRPVLGDGHWLLAQVESLLGEAAAAQGRFEEAEALLTGGFEGLIAAAAKDRQVRKAFERLATFLEARGRSGEIAAYEARIAPAPVAGG